MKVESIRPTTWYGFYSASQAADTGTCWYSTPDGREMECTAVYLNDPKGRQYLPADKVALGPVSKWIRGRMDLNPKSKTAKIDT